MMENILTVIDKIDNDIFELEEKLSHLKKLEADKEYQYWYDKSKDIVDDWIFNKTLKEAKNRNISHGELKDNKSLEIAHGETLLLHRIEYISNQLAKKKRAYKRKLNQYEKLQGRAKTPQASEARLSQATPQSFVPPDNNHQQKASDGIPTIPTTNGLEDCIHLKILGQPLSITELNRNVKKVRMVLSPDTKPIEQREEYDKLLSLYLQVANEVIDSWDDFYDPTSNSISDTVINKALGESHGLSIHIERFNKIYKEK